MTASQTIRYHLIFTEPVVLGRRTKCATCAGELLKGREVVRAYFAEAYYSRTRSYCLDCEIPEEIDIEIPKAE
jgi:hypothetical protein